MELAREIESVRSLFFFISVTLLVLYLGLPQFGNRNSTFKCDRAFS
jgi:hypothetical protein